MNEELQSTNEELETINDELRDRTAELNQVNDFLESILTSLGIAVAVVDRQQRVQVWNHRAEDLWGLRQDEAVEHHCSRSTSGCRSSSSPGRCATVLSGTQRPRARELEAVNRRGRTIACVDDDPAAAGGRGRRRRRRARARRDRVDGGLTGGDMTRGDPDFEAFERSAHERARRAEERERTARQRAERARADAARARDDAVRLEREREAEAHERAAAAHRLAVDFQHEHAQHSRQQAERRGGDQPAEG